jgi:hypothetical protein
VKAVHRATLQTTLTLAALVALTESFYLRPGLLSGRGVLGGTDFYQLHIRRMRFAREALLGGRHTIPGWYPREALGTPFAANLQSFPWIPTRLVLLLLDPAVAYGAAVAIAAALAAIFTYLYCRRAGLTRIGAATAGGTFAGAGFFASRVMAGHLPVLEAYPALPLLLWLVDRTERRRDLAVLALATACVVLAGHPQLPAYAVVSAILYGVWKHKGALRARVVGAMALGAGLTLAVWWPMLLLIGRSTRVLRLAPAENDISMPYGRLLALVVPGIHGWPYPIELAEAHRFTGYPNGAYFWDTASYFGILPLAAMAALGIGCLVRKRMPEGRWMFLACLGVGATILSLPLASPLQHLLPGTLLRSPARLLYIATFGAAASTGVCADLLRKARWAKALLLVVLAAHFGDQWWFAHWFIQVNPREEDPPSFQAIVDRETGEARIAEERTSEIHSNDDRHDDAGGFDSIFLVGYYRGIYALAGAPPGVNRQWIDASELPKKALEATGVKFVITEKARPDLEPIDAADEMNLYRVENPAPRAGFFPNQGTGPWPVEYGRPSSDEIVLHAASATAGRAWVLESWDPGWRATVDARAAPVEPTNGLAMAVSVPAGTHTVRLHYETPGRAAGVWLSLASLAGLVWLITGARRRT